MNLPDLPFVSPQADTVTPRSAKQNIAGRDGCKVLRKRYIIANTCLSDVSAICHSGKFLFVPSRTDTLQAHLDAQIHSETIQLKNNLFLPASKI